MSITMVTPVRCARCRKHIDFYKGHWWSQDDDFMCPDGEEEHADGGRYTVQTVSTTDKGRWFRVTGPHGFEVMLHPWAARHSSPIKTIDQLREVLAREGEDFSTLKEIGK